MITLGEGKHKVWLKEERMDDGIVYILGGGEESHIGGVAIKSPEKDVQTIGIDKHRDLDVLIPLAEAACKKHGCRVVATGGIHIDNASKSDIEIVVKNCRDLLKCI